MNTFVFLSENVMLITCGKACKCLKSAIPIGSDIFDVWITLCICCAIVIIALICICAHVIIFLKKTDKAGNDNTKDISLDTYYKQRSDLIEKKLQILKELCKTDNKLNSDEVVKYTDRIDEELRILNNKLGIEIPTTVENKIEEKKPAETKNE